MSDMMTCIGVDGWSGTLAAVQRADAGSTTARSTPPPGLGLAADRGPSRRCASIEGGAEAAARRGVNPLNAAADPGLQTLLRELAAAVDPQGVWPRVRTLRVPLDIGGGFVEQHQPGMFSAPGAYAEVSLDEERVVMHEVPGPGQRAVFTGDVVQIWRTPNDVKVKDDMPRRLLDKGADPAFLLDTFFENLPFPVPAPLVGDAKLSKHEVVYFFAYALRFYLRLVHLLQDPRTVVRRLPATDRRWDEVPDKLGIDDPRRYIGLRVRWPEDERTHSRDMELFFDPDTKLLAFFRFDVDTLNEAFRAWYRTSDWSADPQSGLVGAGRRRAIVSPIGEIPGQPWTVKAKMGTMTAVLDPISAVAVTSAIGLTAPVGGS